MTDSDSSVTLRMSAAEARALWHAACMAVQLMGQVDVAPDAPLAGQRQPLAAVARRLDREIGVAEASAMAVRRGGA